MDKQADDTLVLRELVPVDPLLPEPATPAWVWLAISGSIIAAIVLTLLLARRRKRIEDPTHARQQAYQIARDELAAGHDADPRVAATRASSSLRRYLAAAVGDPALFETHEEFVARHSALATYPETLRLATSSLFTRLAALKYGREAATSPGDPLSDARQLLEQLHQHPPA